MKKLLPVALLLLVFSACKKADITPQANEISEDLAATSGAHLELMFEDSLYQLTGVAVAKNGRLFTNYPKWRGPHKFDLVEITGKNKVKPYPNREWNSWKPGDDGKVKWVCVQAVYIDDANRMWVVDPAAPKMAGVVDHFYKLVRINMQTNTVERIYYFNNIADKGSYINDVRVDTATQYAYLTNSNEGGIVVVDLRTGKMRQVLQGTGSVIAQGDLTFGNRTLRTDFGEPVKINSDGIALTPDGNWLYYKPLSDHRLFRIATRYLRNFSMSPTRLASKVNFVGAFSLTDGMIFDKQGNLYLGDMQHYRIVKISPSLQITTLVKDDRLIWPDSYSISDDSYLYLSCSQIQKQPEYNLAETLPSTPYTIFRIKIQ